MSVPARPERHRLARCAVLLACLGAAGMAGCGKDDSQSPPAVSHTQGSTAASSAPARPNQARRLHLTVRERQQARRALRRLRQGSRTPPNVVADSGVIP